MLQLTLITGNAGKRREWLRLMPDWIDLRTASADLIEIQSLDSVAIAQYKAEQAYKLVGQPVVVEDVSAGIDELGGLPGPFVRFFEDQLGPAALYILAGKPAAATVTCSIVYYDGQKSIIASGTVHGTIGPLRGENGFGFDRVFTPAGQTKTYAELAPAEKDTLSHRYLAISDLLRQLKEL